MNPSKLEIAGMDKDALVSFLPMEAIGDDGSLDLSREKALAEVQNGYRTNRRVMLQGVSPERVDYISLPSRKSETLSSRHH